MHAETGGVAGALIPPASYSGSGLGKTDLSTSAAIYSTSASSKGLCRAIRDRYRSKIM